jgi:hypothetical protein
VSDIIVVLTEDALTAADVAHITGLYADRDVQYHVLVPADTAQNMLASLVDHLSLGELREALDAALGREPEPVRAELTARQQLDASVAAFAATGATVDGVVVADDPLPALRTAVAGQLFIKIAGDAKRHAMREKQRRGAVEMELGTALIAGIEILIVEGDTRRGR